MWAAPFTEGDTCCCRATATSKREMGDKDGRPNGATSERLSTWEKIRMGQRYQWEKDDLKRVVHWFRQIVALLFGIAWGLLPFKGFNAFASHFIVNVVSTIVFYSSVLGVDVEEYGGHGTMAQESLAPAVSMFMLSWIVTYSMVQF